jgi:hypothetical protein
MDIHPKRPEAIDIHKSILNSNACSQIRSTPEKYSEAEYASMWTSEEWKSVAIVRSPYDRVVSCYWNKFVQWSDSRTVDMHALPVYQYFYGHRVHPVDFKKGVTFCQFIQYINTGGNKQLCASLIESTGVVGDTYKTMCSNILTNLMSDSHWCPQSEYLKGFHWDHIIPYDNIDLFKNIVHSRIPRRLRRPIQMVNKHVPNPELEDLPEGVDASHMTPVELKQYKKPPNSAFLSDDVKKIINNLYSLDFILLEHANRTNGNGAAKK